MPIGDSNGEGAKPSVHCVAAVGQGVPQRARGAAAESAHREKQTKRSKRAGLFSRDIKTENGQKPGGRVVGGRESEDVPQHGSVVSLRNHTSHYRMLDRFLHRS